MLKLNDEDDEEEMKEEKEEEGNGNEEEEDKEKEEEEQEYEMELTEWIRRQDELAEQRHRNLLWQFEVNERQQQPAQQQPTALMSTQPNDNDPPPPMAPQKRPFAPPLLAKAMDERSQVGNPGIDLNIYIYFKYSFDLNLYFK
jgi:hypothetical protein